jgi:radical SAM-linked protein
VDSLDPAWFEEIKRVRKTGFTLAPEAGNDRVRKIINKRLTNHEILRMVEEIFAAGWALIKLYFMIGLPGEEDGDVQDIARLVKEVAGRAGRKGKVNASVAAFVPKAHTPFMWMPQISLEESRRRTEMIRGALKDSRVRLKWNQHEMSWLEGIFSRGDRRLTKAVIRAWEMGARYDAWGEHFNLSKWIMAFNDSGVDPAFYLNRQRSLDEILPWDHIECGVKKEFLLRERQRALDEKPTPDCREQCIECGVCDHESVSPVLFKAWEPPITSEGTYSRAKVAARYRLVFTKTGAVRYLSHLELARLFIRALKRARVSLVYSAGYHPMPRLSFASALPVGTESMHETLDIQVYEFEPVSTIEEGLNSHLPAGIRVVSIKKLPGDSKSPRPVESVYEIFLNRLKVEKGDLERFLRSHFYLMTKKGKKGERSINVRPLVKSIDILDSGRLRLVALHTNGPEFKPWEIVKSVFHLREEDLLKVLKTDEVLE